MAVDTRIVSSELFNQEDVQRTISLLTTPGQVFEIRIVEATLHGDRSYPATYGGYFDNASDLVKALKSIRSATACYITLQQCHPDLLHRAKNKLGKQGKGSSTSDKDITRYTWLPIDCDPERIAGISSTNEEHEQALYLSRTIRDQLQLLGWPDPIEADSGNGAHLLYKIDLETTDSALVKRVLEGIAARFDTPLVHVDKTLFNPSRVIKLYGTRACKGDNTTERPHRMSQLLDVPTPLQTVARAQLEAIATPIAAQRSRAIAEMETAQHSHSARSFSVEDFLHKHNIPVKSEGPYEGGTRYLLESCVWDSSHTDHSACVYQFSDGRLGASCSHNSCSGKGWKDFRVVFEPEAYTSKSNGHYRQTDLDQVDQDDTERPKIIVAGQLRDVCRDALAALALAYKDNPSIFVRDSNLVKVTRDEHGKPVIAELGIAELRNLLTKSANYFKLRKVPHTEEFEPVHVSPPREIAESLLAFEATEYPFPALLAIVETPQLRPDGTILDKPGYDKSTKLFYMPSSDVHVPSIPNHPTEQDIKKAVDLVKGFVQDYPFVEESDRANLLGLWMTIITRHIVRHVPLALINGNTPATGKGLMTDQTALIGTGGTASSISECKDDTEWRKQITSILMAGATMVSIDNVDYTLKSSVLAKVLTSDTHNDRVLGQSKMVNSPQKAVWIANGNNIQLSGDLGRRCYWINMQSDVSDPWNRSDFKYPNLMKSTLQQRGEIIAALLTLARAWFDAGKPEPRKKLAPVATFTEWSETVGGILSHAGIDGFLENNDNMRAKGDIESAAWSIFLEMWAEKIGKEDLTAKQLVERWKSTPELAETLPSPIDGWHQEDKKDIERRVGQLLAKKCGRPYGPKHLKIMKGSGNTVRKVATFKVTGLTPVPPVPHDTPEKGTGLTGLTGVNFNSEKILHRENDSVDTCDTCDTKNANGQKITPLTPLTPYIEEPTSEEPTAIEQTILETYEPHGVYFHDACMICGCRIFWLSAGVESCANCVNGGLWSDAMKRTIKQSCNREVAR